MSEGGGTGVSVWVGTGVGDGTVGVRLGSGVFVSVRVGTGVLVGVLVGARVKVEDGLIRGRRVLVGPKLVGN